MQFSARYDDIIWQFITHFSFLSSLLPCICHFLLDFVQQNPQTIFYNFSLCSFVRSVFFCSSSSDAEHFNGIVFHPIYNLFWVNIFFFPFILFYFFRSRWVKIKTNHLVNSFNCTIFMAYHISFGIFANWAIFVFSIAFSWSQASSHSWM